MIWLQQHWIEIVIVLIIGAIVANAIRMVWKRRKKGCGCGCPGCEGNRDCQESKKQR